MPRPAKAPCIQQEALTPEQLATVFMQCLQQPGTSWPDIVKEVVADCRAATAWTWPNPKHYNAAEYQPTQQGSQVRQTACRGAARGDNARLPDSLHNGRPPTATELMTGLHLSQSPEQQQQQQQQYQGCADYAAETTGHHPTLSLQGPQSALGIFAECDSCWNDDDDLELLQAAMNAKALLGEEHLSMHGIMDTSNATGTKCTNADQHEKGHHRHDDEETSRQKGQYAAPWDCSLPTDMQGPAFQMEQQQHDSDIIFDWGDETRSPAQLQQRDRTKLRESHEASAQKSAGQAMQAEADSRQVCTQDIPMSELSGDEDIVFPDEQPGCSNQMRSLDMHPKHDSGLLQHASSAAHSIHKANDQSTWMTTLCFEDMPEEGQLPHHGEAGHASQHDSLQEDSSTEDAGTLSEAAQQFRSDSLQQQGRRPQAAEHAIGQHIVANMVLQIDEAPEHAHNKDIIFDDIPADHSAHWLQIGSPNQNPRDSNAYQEARQADIASGSAIIRQKRIREELRDRLIQVRNFTILGSRATFTNSLPL